MSSCKNRIVVALSGGVDSSVAAYLLAQQSLSRSSSSSQLIGLFMNNWDASDEGKNNTSTTFCVNTEKDWYDAQSVCTMLGMQLYRGNFSSEYWTQVFAPFLQGMQNTTAATTPNPDMLCNSKIKFGAMKHYALHRFNASCIATGHYARLWRRHKEEWTDEWTDDIRGTDHDSHTTQRQNLVEELHATGNVPDWMESWGVSSQCDNVASPLLVVGADLSKDQSYFLSMTPGIAFKNVMFPLGYLTKQTLSLQQHQQQQQITTAAKESLSRDNNMRNLDDNIPLSSSVRDIASQAGLSTANKKDSSGICFIGKRRFPEFISEYLPLAAQQEGEFVCVDTGKVVGTHKGCALYTIGQGAKISGALQKWFVASKDSLNLIVYVCSSTHHPSLYTHELHIDSNIFNWIGGEPPPPLLASQDDSASMQGVMCRTRHLQPLAECEVSYNSALSRLRVMFHRPIRAVTPGQTAALYVAGGLICLGGGPILSRGPSYHELGLSLPSILHPAGHNDLSVLKLSQ